MGGRQGGMPGSGDASALFLDLHLRSRTFCIIPAMADGKPAITFRGASLISR